MPASPDFRSWAARVANQAANERDDREVLRLMSIAVYWERLADLENWNAMAFQPPTPKHTGGAS